MQPSHVRCRGDLHGGGTEVGHVLGSPAHEPVRRHVAVRADAERRAAAAGRHAGRGPTPRCGRRWRRGFWRCWRAAAAACARQHSDADRSGSPAAAHLATIDDAPMMWMATNVVSVGRGCSGPTSMTVTVRRGPRRWAGPGHESRPRRRGGSARACAEVPELERQLQGSAAA